MFRFLKSIRFVVAGLSAAALVLGLTPAGAGHRHECRAAFLQHLKASPDGLAIYAQVTQPGIFESWMRCDDAQLGLPTAVHESTHVIAAETDRFPLVGGGAVERPHDVSAFYPPYRIAAGFETDDLVSIYLRRGRASSSTDFLYLLDELNAYSHDLNAAVDLKDLKHADESVDHRDGVAAMMAFVAAYAERAKASEPETWQGLREPRVRRVVSVLWGQAERVLSASCGIPNFGHSDKSYIQRFCAAGPQSAIGRILGRAPTCPQACLQEAPGELASGETETLGDTPFVDFRPAKRRRTSGARARTVSSVLDPD